MINKIINSSYMILIGLANHVPLIQSHCFGQLLPRDDPVDFYGKEGCHLRTTHFISMVRRDMKIHHGNKLSVCLRGAGGGGAPQGSGRAF